jgi:hypothetical protein
MDIRADLLSWAVTFAIRDVVATGDHVPLHDVMAEAMRAYPNRDVFDLVLAPAVDRARAEHELAEYHFDQLR